MRLITAPNFVSSLPYGDYIFFFYRETAVEYMNCGKVSAFVVFVFDFSLETCR
jgi:hypothetical protein